VTPHRLRMLAAVVLPVVLLTGACSSGGSASTPTTAASGSSAAASATVNTDLDKIKVTYDGSAAPKLDLPSTPYETSVGYRIVKDGTGEELTATKTATANFLVLTGKDGKTVESSFTTKTPAPLSLAEGKLLPAIRSTLLGRKVGTQALISVPASQFSADSRTQMSLSDNDTLLFFFDITGAKTPLTQAEGTAVAPKAGVPTVKMGAKPTDPATFTVPKGFASPKTTQVEKLIIGSGATVKTGQTVTVSYTGVTLANPGTPFDYSGKAGGSFDTVIGSGAVIKAWDKAIVGQTVGSRILIIAPPAEAYPNGQGTIKKTDTLLFVVDILDAN
jgi:FKBP-type peptidyl-prolyl cis-trans isomerase